MDLLSELLDQDPSAPRLTVYDEARGTRLDFSALTLDNWAAKVANLLYEEFDLGPGDTIRIDLPVSWQPVAITLGALAAGITVQIGDAATDTGGDDAVVFTSLDAAGRYPESELAIVTDDPFGRGVAEIGEVLPVGAVDFGPTVRFYGDQFPQPTPRLSEIVAPTFASGERTLGLGWSTWEELVHQVLGPLAAGGSTVIVAGLADTHRLDAIAETEKVTHRLSVPSVEANPTRPGSSAPTESPRSPHRPPVV